LIAAIWRLEKCASVSKLMRMMRGDEELQRSEVRVQK
jgi:hypothetical protein